MKSLKERLYNYEEAPPMQSWPAIAAVLDNENIQVPVRNKSRVFYISLAAAAVTILIFSAIIWAVNSYNTNNSFAANQSKTIDTNSHKITVPQTGSNDDVADNKSNPENFDRNIDNTTSSSEKKYLTISGPQGERIKISSKAASLIVSSDDQNPPNPVWSEKVKKWKDIMKTQTLAPTTSNFLDIVELTEAVTINK